MLDKLQLHIPFHLNALSYHEGDFEYKRPFVDLKNLGFEMEFSSNVVYGSNGVVSREELRTKFESLPSSHSGMAMKIYDRGLNSEPFVMIKCSPAKLLQGHNLYGFDDLYKAGSNMLALLSASYPELFEMLDVERSVVSEIDLNYSVFIDNPENKKLFLDHLRYTSKGQTKNRNDNYATSIYFGAKNSRLKKLKVYSKFEEMKEDLKNVKSKGYDRSADTIKKLLKTDRCKNAVRFEATIKKRYFERRGIKTNFFDMCRYFIKNDWAYEALFNDAWRDIFEALDGQEITKMNDNEIYTNIYDAFHTVDKKGNVRTTKVNRIFSFYQTMKILGYEHVKNITSESAFYRNITDLKNCGLSHSFLQNLNKDSGALVIQMSRFIKIDFNNQVPSDYKMPPDLFNDAA